ncbi:acyl carrier protein [Rummeliibacillus suwonensis]|uniref:acyl carrier protein n=1 Tax=Rummeliibacillus suwonensis TaxID=1306154 RepID=UPI001AB00A52|nr:acyl carrier protein [Rummeliibacillus suwonensis]MBO2535957.1 acyl carrier protein [Rummeliibacillus suwonensis]
MKEKIKQLFIQVFNLDLTVEEIKDNEDLFGVFSSYDLDSMDVLTFINELKKEYELNYGSLNPDSFKTINNIVDFVEKQKI